MPELEWQLGNVVCDLEFEHLILIIDFLLLIL